MEVKRDLKVFIAGQKKLAADIMQLCINTHGVEVVGYAGNKDDKHLGSIAAESNIKLFDMNSPPPHDIGITAHCFEKILPGTISKAEIGWVGYHPSLLPRHRGRHSIKAALQSGDSIVGGTIYWLNESFDAGDIATQDWTWRNHDKPLELWVNTLAPLGLKLMSRFLFDVLEGKVVRQKQNEQFATYC